MADTATLTARLAEAEDALHKLRTGRSVVEVRTETESVKYTPATIGALAAYVRELKIALGQSPRGGAIGVGFR